MNVRAIVGLAAWLCAAPSLAQAGTASGQGAQDGVPEAQAIPRPTPVAPPPIGRQGQRLQAQQTAPRTPPLDRIDTRIPNRVQSRLRTRLDPSYVPGETAADPFRAAEAQTRRGTQRR